MERSLIRKESEKYYAKLFKHMNSSHNAKEMAVGPNLRPRCVEVDFADWIGQHHHEIITKEASSGKIDIAQPPP